jgi:hypothetical protein
MSLFDDLSSAITKILIVLGVLMVLSFVVLVVLTAMERSKTPYRRDDDPDDYGDYDDFFTVNEQEKTTRRSYDGAPDPEEISYTKRMLAMKDEGQSGVVNNGADPIRLPPPPHPGGSRPAGIPKSKTPGASHIRRRRTLPNNRGGRRGRPADQYVPHALCNAGRFREVPAGRYRADRARTAAAGETRRANAAAAAGVRLQAAAETAPGSKADRHARGEIPGRIQGH